MSSPAWDTQPGGLNSRRHVSQSGGWTSQPACCQASLSSWLGDSLLLTLSPLCPRSWVSSRKDTALLDDAPPPPWSHPASLHTQRVEAGATDEPTGAAGPCCHWTGFGHFTGGAGHTPSCGQRVRLPLLHGRAECGDRLSCEAGGVCCVALYRKGAPAPTLAEPRSVGEGCCQVLYHSGFY